MYRRTINCQSCEVKSDVIIRQTNFDEEEIEVEYCPVCSANIIDTNDFMDSDYEE